MEGGFSETGPAFFFGKEGVEMSRRKKKCEGTYIDDSCREKKCHRIAVTRRKSWRFGGTGESTIVEFYTHLCARCAETFDECRREAEWEARVS
jgi:hypothetical protein